MYKIKDKEAITNSGTTPIIPNIYVDSTKIRLCLHPTDLITQRFETTFVETVQDTAIKYQGIIDNTASIFQNVTPDFLRLLKTTCRELVVFNSETQYSMAALSYYGVGFINVANETRKELFFVDDIAHQCGHVIFHALTLKVENFLKVHKDSPLKEFTYIDGESRTVYGAFHGLFTYTTILHCLDKCLDNSIFHENDKHETIGRLGFYMDKFQKDLEHMNDKRMLTNQGFEFYEMFLSGYKKIKKKYSSLLSSLDYKNQPYLFNYKLFQAINPLNQNNMKFFLLLFFFLSFTTGIAQTNDNYQKTLGILQKAQNVLGKSSSGILVTANGTIHNMGHYATPELTQDLPIEETYAYFAQQQVYHLRSAMQRSGRTFVKSKVAKQDSLYSVGYYDQSISKTVSPDFAYEIAKMIPSELLAFTYKNRQSLRYLGEQDPYVLLSFSYKGNQAITLYIDKKNNFLEKVETLNYDNIYGDVSLMTEYKNYTDKKGLKVPQNRLDYEFGRVERELVYNDVKFDVKPDTNYLKIIGLPKTFQNQLLENVSSKEKLVFESLAPTLDIIKIVSQNNKILVAQFKDFVALLETPAGVALNRQVLEEIKTHYPQKPLRHLFLTHHHPDHAGGIRAYADLPLTLTTTQGNEAYFKKILHTNHTFSSENLDNDSQIKFDFVPIQSQKSLSDEQNEIIAYEIGKNTTHTDEHLVYYFPKTKILWTGDLLFFHANGKTYPAGDRGKSIYDLIISKNLAVDKIYTSWPLHGQKDFGTLGDLKNAIELK